MTSKVSSLDVAAGGCWMEVGAWVRSPAGLGSRIIPGAELVLSGDTACGRHQAGP